MTADDGKQKVVCILGMHRSGTSAVARIVNLLGVDLGSPEVLAFEPAHDNAKGHWENTEIASINEAIFRNYHGSWHEPPTFPTAWELSPELAGLRADAERLIKDQFAHSSLWGWKDPRTCLTLPFWRQLLSEVHYILCLRNPVDVASSLEHRDQFLSEKSFHLWATYVSSALQYTEGKPRIVVFYQDVVDDSATEFSRLAQFLGQPELAGDEDLRDKVQSFVEKGLQHHQSTELDTLCNSTSGRTAKALYLSQRISAKLATKKSIESAVLAALETLNPDLATNSTRVNQRARLKSLAKDILESGEIDHWISTKLEAQTCALTARAESAEANARTLGDQLRERDSELNRIKETAGFRFLSRCWRIKHKYLPRSDS